VCLHIEHAGLLHVYHHTHTDIETHAHTLAQTLASARAHAHTHMHAHTQTDRCQPSYMHIGRSLTGSCRVSGVDQHEDCRKAKGECCEQSHDSVMRDRSFSCGMGHVLAHHVVDDEGTPVDDGVLDCGVTQVDEGEVPGAPVAHCAPGAHLHSCHGLVSLCSVSQNVVLQCCCWLAVLLLACAASVSRWSCSGVVCLCSISQKVVMQWCC